MGDGIKIILADSDFSFRMLFSDAIENEVDLELVAVVGDGQEALEMTKKLCPDVLILDVILPNIDGLDVVAELNKGKNKPEIIVQTAFTSQAVTTKCRELGIEILIAKPCSMDSLLEKIRYIVGNHEKAINGFDMRMIECEHTFRKNVSELLQKMGASAHYSGYYYMRESVVIKLMNNGKRLKLTKDIYPEVAVRFQTTDLCVERDMRTMVDAMWANGANLDTWRRLGLPCPSKKPTNAQLMAMIAENVCNCCCQDQLLGLLC